MGHIGTNYTLSRNQSYLSDTMEYLHSVTSIIQPTKCLICAENDMAMP